MVRETLEDVKLWITKRVLHLSFKQEQRTAVEEAVKGAGLPIPVFRNSAMWYYAPLDAETVRAKLQQVGFKVGDIQKYNW